MRLVALVESPDHVCCRYRIAAFRYWLESVGYRLDLEPMPRRFWSRLRLFQQLRGETVILQRFLLPGWQLGYLRKHVRHLIFDFDDAVFLRDSYSVKGMHHPRRLRRFADTVRLADVVVAGNSFLADSAAHYTDRSRIRIVPTCIDPMRYSPRSESSDGRSLVWIGSSSTLQGLESIAPLLDDLGRSIPGLCLKVICDRFPTFRDLPVLPCPWRESTEAEDLASGDIGISWIPDDLWSRGKCGLKVLQYMAAGLPVVCNPVGVHPDMVRHGVTGFLPASPEGWREAIGGLVADPSLRERMGRTGRDRIETDFSVEAGGQTWLELLGRLDGSLRKAS